MWTIGRSQRGEEKKYRPIVRKLRYSFFFQEKMLGDISFKLETKIMNFMSVFFEKKYNQGNLSVVNNMQYNLFTIFPLSGSFAEFFFFFY